MITAAWILLIPFGILSILNWIGIFLNDKLVNIRIIVWVITFVSTIITALSAGVIWG